jgi:hypothetical protein
MSASSEIILSNQVHPGDSTNETVTGEKFRGDGYYGRSDGFHTVQINLSGYIGTIEIQATLAIDPVDADWFTVELGTGTMSVDTTGALAEQNITFVSYNEATTNSKSYNFTGNYVWVRAKVSNWTDGTVNSIHLNH